MMKQVNRFCSILVTVTVLFACNGSASKSKDTATTGTVTRAIELDKRFSGADSLVIVFYKDPYGADSLRYTRYFTQYISGDSNHIKVLLNNLDEPFEKLEKIKNCRSEGKIWCYSKGNIFQTVYFSTRCADCCFLYLIKDGYFYYVKINDSVKAMLALTKPISKENLSK
jgi:hypothetical protein